MYPLQNRVTPGWSLGAPCYDPILVRADPPPEPILLFAHVLVPFPVPVKKCPDKRKLRQKGFIWLLVPGHCSLL